jgi:NarL family two-component system response regulator LiaR
MVLMEPKNTILQKMIRVVLVDDHHVVRRGMRSYLESFPDLRVVGEAASAEALLQALPALQADVVMMDLLLPGGMDGIEATRRVRAAFPSVQVVVLTAYTDEARVIAALRAGAISFVRKDAQPEFLLSVIRAAAAGQALLDPGLASALVQDSARGGIDLLSPREQEVLRLVARGQTNREIAARLVLGEETVKTHVASILAKLGLSHRSQVAMVAIKQGWVSVEDG